MKKLLFILYFIPFFAACQKGVLGVQSTRRDTMAFYGKTIAFMGNSFMVGTGASDANHRWSTLFTVSKGGIEQNFGIGGLLLQNANSCGNFIFDRTTIPTYTTSYSIMFIDLGINDILVNNPSLSASNYALTMDSVITYAHNTKGWPYIRIIIITPNWFLNYAAYNPSGCGYIQPNVTIHEQYVAAAISTAVARTCPIIDIYTAEKNDPNKLTYLSADNLHPNNAGYAYLANYYGALTYYQ